MEKKGQVNGNVEQPVTTMPVPSYAPPNPQANLDFATVSQPVAVMPSYPPPYQFSNPGYQPQNVFGAIQQQPNLSMPPNACMTVSNIIQNCPSGLEYLTQIDQLLVHQNIKLVLTNCEMNNKYTIKNALGQKIYYAVEDNDCCTRNCCGPSRSFDMKVYDIFQREVLNFYRPFAVRSICCFPCSLQSIEVKTPGGQLLGSIEQEWTLCYPQYSVKNHIGDVVLRIEGPFCTVSCCNDVDFQILGLDGDPVGKISKQWSGLVQEMFTDANNFGISFPMNLDVRMKAVLLSACILIDMMFYEAC